jgi:F0F1-type ATP synthase assembly protein I
MAKPPGDDSYSALRSAGLLLAIPTLLIVSPLVGFFAGAWLDRTLHSNPWFSIAGLVLGFVAAGRETWLVYRRSLAEEQRQADEKNSRKQDGSGGVKRP